MKLLVLSDIVWGQPFSVSPGTTLKSLEKLVLLHRPDAILFAGDLVDDKRGDRAGYWSALHRFVKFLVSRSIPSLAVHGNWDEPERFAELTALGGFYDISEQFVEFAGLTILGVSHAATQNLTYMRELRAKFSSPIDIVLAHAEFRRRPWLFMLDSRLVVTGHFDTVLSIVDNKVYVSMWGGPSTYGLIVTRASGWRATLVVGGSPHLMPHALIREGGPPPIPRLPIRAVAGFRRGIARSEPQPPLFRSLAWRPDYAAEMAGLLTARREILAGRTGRAEEEGKLHSIGVPKRQVREVLAYL